MSSVTQCDVCGKVVKHHESKYVRINRKLSDDAIGQEPRALDVCPKCYVKLCELLKVEVRK